MAPMPGKDKIQNIRTVGTYIEKQNKVENPNFVNSSDTYRPPICNAYGERRHPSQ